MDNFDISHSEKDFLGGWRRGREAGGALSGDLTILNHKDFGLYQTHSLCTSRFLANQC